MSLNGKPVAMCARQAITYKLQLPGGIFEPKSASNQHGGALSRAQLETIHYACQRHEIRIPSGERAGFFLGDGVGLGKGRQLAGIILHNWRRGTKRHVWISVSADLCVDALEPFTLNTRHPSNAALGHLAFTGVSMRSATSTTSAPAV